jgi:outer membrane protein
MKSLKISLLLGGLITLATNQIATAQDKFGYVDESYVLAQMPEYKQTQIEIEAYQKQIQAELEAKKKIYDEKVKTIKSLDQKTTPKPVLESKVKEITELEKQMSNLTQVGQAEAQNRLAKKLQPLTERIKKAIEQVAQEKNTSFIFRRESIVFQVEENNLSDLVIKKLNLTLPTPTTPVPNRGELKTSNKFAYFSSDYVIVQLPAYKAAESEIKTYQEQMKKQIEALTKTFQQKYQETDPGTNPAAAQWTDAIRKAKMEELEKLQTQIEETKQRADKQSKEKFNKLMEPIYKELQTKLDQYAKEQNYTFVFKLDASLQEPETSNISDAILQKFGVTPKTDKK